MNAYFEPLYPSLATGVASPDKTFGLWLQSSGVLHTSLLPLATTCAVAGIAYLGYRKAKGLPALAGGQGKSAAASFVLGAALSAGVLIFGPSQVRVSDRAVMPVWQSPSASQVLQALTQCEYWVSPVQGVGRYTCPQRYGQPWEKFAESVNTASDDPSGPVSTPVMRSVTSAQMQVLAQTAQRLAAKFAQQGCYMPAHPAAHVWCQGSRETVTLVDWAMAEDGQAWSYRNCSYGKSYVYTAKQHLEPKIEKALGSRALVRYVMPIAVSCGGESVKVEQLGDWLVTRVASGVAGESTERTAPGVDVALLR